MSDTPPPKFSTGPVDEKGDPIYDSADYQPVLSNWFTAKPYGFRYTPKDDNRGGRAMVMYLPIGPSNLNITTQFATNLIPTLYGTVEEHSPVRYYDITIEGTTGMVPKYIQPEKPGSASPKGGRTTFAVKQSLSVQAGGFFAKTLSTAENILQSASNIVNQFNGAGAITGVQLDKTGYYAFHNLYRFLLKYKKNASGIDDSSKGKARTTDLAPLVFFNYKDNNEYSVVIRNFTLRRDRNDPMLYNYNITMRGYDLRAANQATEIDGNKAVDALLSDLGLDGVKDSVLLGQIKSISSEAKGILGSVANGVNQLGR